MAMILFVHIPIANRKMVIFSEARLFFVTKSYEYKVSPATLVFVFGGLYQFLRYFYDTFVAHF